MTAGKVVTTGRADHRRLGVGPIMVLGASGFLGAHVCEALRHRDDQPSWVGVARKIPASTEPTDSWHRLDLVHASAADYEHLLRRVRPSLVINCAGTSTGPSNAMRAANMHVVRKLLAALGRLDSVRLIQLGSAGEYGPQPHQIPIAESAATHPASPYAMTKLMATNLIVAAISEERIRGTVLRVFNPVGAGAPASGLAGQAARAMYQAMAVRSPTITLGPLEVHRDFVAAADVGTAAALAANAQDLPAILNVGRGVAMSGDALITLLEHAAGFDGQVIRSGRGSPRSAWVPWQQADVTLLRQHLGWVPTTPIVNAVAALWAGTGARITPGRAPLF